MKKILKLDYLLLLPLFITCTLGIIMMYSASSIVAVQHYGYNSRHFVDSQLTKLLLGTIGLVVCAILPYENMEKTNSLNLYYGWGDFFINYGFMERKSGK